MRTHLPLLPIWTCWQTEKFDLNSLTVINRLRPLKIRSHAGSHSTSTGLYGLGNHLRKTADAVTIPQYFAKYGYKTESLGKIFHIGHGNYGT